MSFELSISYPVIQVPVEKVVQRHVPVDVERVVTRQVPVPYPVDRVVTKHIQVPVEKVVDRRVPVCHKTQIINFIFFCIQGAIRKSRREDR